MESPFKPTQPHEEVAPAWRLLAQILLVLVAGFVALAVLGYVQIRLGKEPENNPDNKSPVIKEDPAKKSTAKSYLRRDPEMEAAFKHFFEDAVVFRSRGAAMEFWLESKTGEEKEVLAGTGTVVRVEDLPTDRLEGTAVLVRKEGGLDVFLASDAGKRSAKSVALGALKPSSKENRIVQKEETVADVAGLGDLVGQEIELHKVLESELVRKGEPAFEKQISRRTVRLMGKVVAVKVGE